MQLRFQGNAKDIAETKGHDLIAMGVLPFSVRISQAFQSYLETSKASRSHVDMVLF